MAKFSDRASHLYDGVREHGDSGRKEYPKTEPLHKKAYKSFLVEHGRFRGEKILLHFADVRCDPEKFLQLLRKTFQEECRIYPADSVRHDTGVMLGGFPELGTVKDAFSVLWTKELPDNMLGFINGKVQALDKVLQG